MAVNKYITLSCDILSTIELLTDEEAGKLFKIIIAYANGECRVIENQILKIAFTPIKTFIDEHAPITGDAHWNWQGGISDKNRSIRSSAKYLEWRRIILNRDNFTCTECMVVGGELHAHHIKPFATFPELRLDVDNGITLCRGCHIKIHSLNGE